MTAADMVQAIRRVGDIRLAQGRVQVRQCPPGLRELARCNEESIRGILEEENFRRLTERFNLKPVTPERMREITGGQPWRILNTRPHSEWKTHYRWERVHHDRECDTGAICSRCYPYH